MSGRAVLEDWFQRVWAEESDAAIEEMFKPEGQATGLGASALNGPAEFKTFRDAMLRLVGQVRIEILDHFDRSDKNVAICRLTGRCRRSDAMVTMEGCCYYVTRDGVITHADNYWDFMGFFEQVGCLETGAFAQALQGGPRGADAADGDAVGEDRSGPRA